MNNYFNKNILRGIVLVILITGCAPSSISDRYEGENRDYGREDDYRGRYEDTPPIPDDKEESPTENAMKPVFAENFEKMLNAGVPVDDRTKLTFEITKLIGTPYIYGGTSDAGFDCSGFTLTVFSRALGKALPRTADQQYRYGTEIPFDKLGFGDLVFFGTGRVETASHVGIYLGNNMFVHSGSSDGVKISSLTTGYYDERYLGARRVFDFGLEKIDTDTGRYGN